MNLRCHGRRVFDERSACKTYVQLIRVQVRKSCIGKMGNHGVVLRVYVCCRARTKGKVTTDVIEILWFNKLAHFVGKKYED